MEQIDEAQTDMKTESVVTDVSSTLERESNHDPESLQNNTQDCTDNFKSDASFINECDTTESTRDVKNKNNGVAESLENMINEVEQLTVNSDMQDDDDQRTNEECKENEIEKSVEAGTDLKCVQDTSMDKENTKTSNDIEACNINENEQQNTCTVNDANAQCQELIKTLSDSFEDKDQSLHSANTDAELSKLVDSSEVMVLTIEETIQVSTEDRDIVFTVQEKESSNETDSSVKQIKKEIKKSEIINEDFNLIDYSQESDGTIIEVISTEIMESEIPEISTQEESNKVSDYVEKDSVTSTTPEVIKDEISINVENDDSTNDEKYNSEEVEANDKNKTEICDSPHKINANKEIVHSKTVASAYNVKQENVSESNKINPVKKRSVIQDIFDDWGDENTEEENQLESKEPDTVEIELKSLLNDTKTQTIEENTILLVEEEIICVGKDTHVESMVEIVKEKNESQNEESDSNQTTKKQHSQNSVVRSMKDHVNFSKSQGKSAKDDTASSQTSSSQVQSVPVNRGRNLTSQIASSAEVTEALKERLREKQKVIETPPQPDIFFVKKLTQRLSSKLAGGPGGVLPALIPLPQPLSCDKKQTDNTSNTGTSKDSNTDNKELLAILEGDVDPDWSNLKPPTLTEEGKRPVKVESSGYNTPPKLNPSIERELALKQLLELPIASSKKSASNKKKISKPAASKAIKEAKTKTTSDAEKEVNVDESNTSNKPENESTDSVPPVEEKKDTELQDSRLDESRSGRKRKLTEKARENEQQQSIVKRQKVYKGKVSVNKKQSQAIETQADTDLTSDNQPKETTLSDNENNADVTKKEEITNKQITNNNKMDSTPEKPENASTKTAKQNLSKKSSQSIAKKNTAAKKVLKQNMPPNKKAAALKTKLNTPAKKQTGTKVVVKSRKSTEGSEDTKLKKKVGKEIDRLLQDEGVVNLLYDVEQSDKKRLVNKSQAKQNYVDMQKVQRELKLRKKLVRNVLRLRTSTSSVSKVSPRSKRTYLNDTQMEKKADQVPSKPTNLSASQEFILPAKIRNAADASIIVRRHSSSSFSSASASPRVSVDTPEKVETIKVEEGGSHALRSTKRRLSQEEKTTTIAKKSKKKAVQKSDTALDTIVEISKDKAVASSRPRKKTDSKKSEKNAKQPEAEEIGKIVTRSNGTATEAANALSVFNAGTQSGISAVTRKGEANANVAKSLESDKTKMGTRSQFSNKEISVCRFDSCYKLRTPRGEIFSIV